MKLTLVRSLWIAAGLGLAAAAQVYVDPPDLQLNPATGLIVGVDAAWSGSNYNVRFTEVALNGVPTQSTLLTSHTANDVDPKIACAANGDVVVVWWRDLTTDVIPFRKRYAGTGLWTPERFAGSTTDSKSHPRIVFAGAQAWVAYQVQNSRSRSVGAQVIDNDPEPVPTIATTTYTGDLDVRISYEAGHLWVTWIDSSSRVGYSEYNFTPEVWAGPATESYASDSVAAARARIRSRITGL